MNIYKYKAVDFNGKVLKGFIKAQDESNATATLTIKNLYIVSISKMPNIFAPFLSLFSFKIKNAELIEFAKNLSIMLKAGIPLTTALSDIAEKYYKREI
jgi:Type II secretory pathway, component PulF